MKTYISLAAVLIVAFASCKKDAHIATPDRKIVVNAQMSPSDDTIRIILDYSKPVNAVSNTGYSNGIYLGHDIRNEFADAKVTLSDGVTTKAIKRDPVERIFKLAQSEFQLIPGKTYQLHIKDAHNRAIDAQTTIPFAVTNATYSFLGEQAAGQYNSKFTNKYVFADQLNSERYYRLYAGQQSGSGANEVLYGNYLEEGKSFMGTDTIVVENIQPKLFFQHPVTAYYGYFFSCSYEYFQFYKSIENTKGLSNTPALLEEPVGIYCNIKGGLGIFAGYNLVKVRN